MKWTLSTIHRYHKFSKLLLFTVDEIIVSLYHLRIYLSFRSLECRKCVLHSSLRHHNHKRYCHHRNRYTDHNISSERFAEHQRAYKNGGYRLEDT